MPAGALARGTDPARDILPRGRAAAPTGTASSSRRSRRCLEAECYRCHSAEAEKVKGGLLLDSREGLLEGGDTGPAVVPGKADESLLVQAIRHEDGLEMPPKKPKLPDVDRSPTSRRGSTWGARSRPAAPGAGERRRPDARTRRGGTGRSSRSGRPRRRRSEDAAWVQNPVDAFILAKLEAARLATRPAGRAGANGSAASRST